MTDKAMEKVVILARGLGTRMRKTDDGAQLSEAEARVAATGVKALMPIGDRPFLDYVLSKLADCGYKDVCLVIGPEHNALRDYYGKEVSPERLNIHFAIQDEPLGTADAVRAAKEFAGGDNFLMINSDNYYAVEALEQLRVMSGPGLAGFERENMIKNSNIPAERVVKFAAIEIEDGKMKSVLEKPTQEQLDALTPPIYLSMNCWRFGPSIFTGCESIEKSARGEYEITDAVNYTMEKLDESYEVAEINGGVLDLSSRGDLGSVQEALADINVKL